LNGRPAAILSHGFWQRKLGGAPDVIGRSVMVNGGSVAVVGVLPPSADLDRSLFAGASVELLLPLPLAREMASMATRSSGSGV